MILNLRESSLCAHVCVFEPAVLEWVSSLTALHTHISINSPTISLYDCASRKKEMGDRRNDPHVMSFCVYYQRVEKKIWDSGDGSHTRSTSHRCFTAACCDQQRRLLEGYFG
jgi:hypothetical protein